MGRAMIDKKLSAQVLRGYLACAQWADAPESSNARFSNAEQSKAARDCEAFIKACGPLFAQALEHIEPERFGHDFWLTRAGHGAGFWDRDELSEPPQSSIMAIDRDGGEYLAEGETLGAALSSIAYGTNSKISRFAYPSVYAYRGWLYFS